MRRVSVKLKKKHPVLRGFGVALAVFLAIVLVLEIGVFANHFYKDAYYPDYQKEDISFVLDKEALSDDDYALIFKQTGLTRAGVDALIFAGKRDDVLKIQEDYFARYEVKKIQFSPLTCCHENYEDIETVPLQNGDVFISPTSHFSFFSLGHSAIVVDAQENKIVNSTGYNNKSCYEDVYAITVDPSFVVLRPKLSHFERTQLVEYVKNELFATLDPTSRSFTIEDVEFMLIDTVGFLQDLPHKLIDAFHSTLESALNCDLALIVCDATGEYDMQRETTLQTLQDMGFSGETLLVMNKTENLSDTTPLPNDSIAISARTGKGIDELKRAILERFSSDFYFCELFVPYAQMSEYAKIKTFFL